MRKKYRIILILVGGALVGSLVIAASLTIQEDVTQYKTPLDRVLAKLGLCKRENNAARNACIANLKHIDQAKTTWALGQNKTNVPAAMDFYDPTNFYDPKKQPWSP